MKNKTQMNTIMISMPFILGIISFLTFALYFYSANHAPYRYIDVIFLGPMLSFLGLIISIITRKSKKTHPTLWVCGLITCSFSFIMCILVVILLIMIMSAAFSGKWL